MLFWHYYILLRNSICRNVTWRGMYRDTMHLWLCTIHCLQIPAQWCDRSGENDVLVTKCFMLPGFQSHDHQIYHDKINSQLLPAAIRATPLPYSNKTGSPNKLAATHNHVQRMTSRPQNFRTGKASLVQLCTRWNTGEWEEVRTRVIWRKGNIGSYKAIVILEWPTEPNNLKSTRFKSQGHGWSVLWSCINCWGYVASNETW